MATECINTIEIRLLEPLYSAFAVAAYAYVAGLQDAPGCLDYTLARSTQEDGLWWLTGYWRNEPQMTQSFESPPMMDLISYLIEAGANLTFGSFVHQPVVSHGD